MSAARTTEINPPTTNDPIAWSHWLVEHHVPKEQADAHAQLISQAVAVKAASKQDLEVVKMELQADIQKSKTDQIRWMIGMLFAQTGFIIGIVKFL